MTGRLRGRLRLRLRMGPPRTLEGHGGCHGVCVCAVQDSAEAESKTDA